MRTVFEQIGAATVDGLRNKMDELRYNASGETRAAIRYEATEKGLKIYAPEHVYALEYGRGATQNGGNGSLRLRILEWIEHKGITPKDPKTTKEELSYAITNKIHREGTELYKQYGGQYPGSGLLSDVLNDALVDSIRKAVAEYYKKEFVATISGAFELLKKAA